MTTIDRQCRRMLKVLGAPRNKAGFIPPQILQECKGLMFFKKLNGGTQGHDASGVLFKREAISGQWSLPTSVHFAEGTVRFGSSVAGDNKTSVCDVVILINDSRTLDAFQAFGQFGFDDQHHRCVKGPIVGGASSGTSDLVNFATACSTDPFYLVQRSFAFSLSSSGAGGNEDGTAGVTVWHGCSVTNAVFQVRDSSNQKYYNNKAATCQALLTFSSSHETPSASTRLAGGLGRQRIDQTLACRQLLAAWMPTRPSEGCVEQGLSKAEIGVPEDFPVQPEIQPEAGSNLHQRRLSFTF